MHDEAVKAAAELGTKGGVARAKALTPEHRAEIARRAAEIRWEAHRAQAEGRVLRATHSGELHIAGRIIPCAVLEDGTRILTQYGFLEAIGRSGKPAARRGSSFERLAPFLDASNLKPYITEDLRRSTTPLQFRTHQGRKAWGYRADLLPQVCEVYLRARDDGALLKGQERFARACDLLMRGLAHVGIVALVDEATGYQEVRDRQALQAILDKYLRKELAAWAKRFPDEFYQHIFRMRGWKWRGMYVNGPRVLAAYTKDIVYKRLAPGILEELERLNPIDDRGVRPAKHHQWLTEDVGHPALAQHLYAVMGLMRISNSWDEFRRHLDRAFPPKGKTLSLPID